MYVLQIIFLHGPNINEVRFKDLQIHDLMLLFAQLTIKAPHTIRIVPVITKLASGPHLRHLSRRISQRMQRIFRLAA